MSLITVGGSSSTGSGYVFGDWIENVYRRVMAGERERAVLLNEADGIGSDDTALTLTGVETGGIRVGNTLAVELEVMYITAWDGTVATVIRGYLGSPPAAHDDGVLCYINPTYTRYDIAVALNDEVRELSSPDNGLFRVGSATITYNPVYVGYDLGDVPAEWLKILEIRYRLPTPYRWFPRIQRWEEVRGLPDTDFPSGNAILLKGAGYPGQPMYLKYSAPFLPLVDYSDDLLFTPATNDPSPPYNGYSAANTANYDGTVQNFAPSMLDIPPLGAIIRLTLPREVARNFLDAQSDPRKAPEVPPGAVGASIAGLSQQRLTRIQSEANRLTKQYPIPRRF